MFFYLILLFTVLPAVELALLIKIGGHIGVMNTLTVIILTGVIGAYLARIQGFTVMRNIQESMNQGRMPTEEMLDGVMILVGGIVLLTPGFLTDTIGFLLLIPITRLLIKNLVRRYIHHLMEQGNITTHNHSSRRINDDFEDADFS
ncbi:MAG: membrane protein FxsA [Candidatus Omnitrophica bacterium]|nr:membrane protein FxsA [Candidatus Omnitrophota bacterium]